MKRIVTLAILSLLIASIALSGIALYQYRANQQNILKTEMAGLSGVVTVSVTDPNGTVVSQTRADGISSASNDFLACVLFNINCNGASGGADSSLLFPSTTITTTATISNAQFYLASLVGIALSTATVNNAGCPGVQTANGLAPSVATGSYSSVAGTVTLSNSWTFTGSSVTITSACLVSAMGAFAPSPFSETVINPSSDMTAYAFETFTGQTLTTGQSIGISWVFTL